MALLLPGGAAWAGVEQSKVVSANPVDHTPHVLDGIVNALAVVGRTVVVGGKFSTVQNAGGRAKLARHNLFAFDLRTGRIDPGFRPQMDGPVLSLAPGPGNTVFAGGSFSRGLVRLSLADGSPDRAFTAATYGGQVTSLVRHGPHLFVGGDFNRIGGTTRIALARLDAVTGAVDPGFHVTPGDGRGGETTVTAMAATANRLVLDGSFTTLDGLARPQLGVIDLTTGRVADWHTAAYAPECRKAFPSYVRGLDLSPDGRYFVVVTTGGPAPGTGKLCDTAARFETYARGTNIRPTWVNHTGGDSLYAVAATGAAVYVGGHQRWLDNPLGADTAGKGAVSRPGIGAIHPVTGKALAWNPTRERGIGVKAFLAVKNGLLVGSDTTRLGREYHARVGMFPMR
ncbi:delta-60 repeat domain-containing protein [Acrocarpospora catenulata]|uniref:delta-60 repeat domain-containing protein n=1 Tax=Acrocarpospora catenulata TaxID=2836182 RepID=UPI0027DF2EC9|nr:delta-60 repeat domain-containing protein [Acrocarpospora catenulata]